MRYIRYNRPTRRFTSAAPFGRSPWRGLDNEIDRLFQTAASGLDTATTARRFPVDLFQDEHNAYLRAQLPGFNREGIKLEVVEGQLTLAATREAEGDKGQPAAEFSRAVTLSDEIKADEISAAYVDGVLTVTLPKMAEVKPRDDFGDREIIRRRNPFKKPPIQKDYYELIKLTHSVPRLQSGVRFERDSRHSRSLHGAILQDPGER